MNVSENSAFVRTELRPVCRVCGTPGVTVYDNLQDRLFGVAEIWSMKKCENSQCGAHWLDPAPIEEDLGKLYTSYYTHIDLANQGTPGALRRFKRRVAAAYLFRRYRVGNPPTSFWDNVGAALLRLNPVWCANLDFSVFYVPLQTGGRLLKVGCGSGTMLARMAGYGWDVTGLDFDERAVANARAKGLEVHHGSLAQQRYSEHTFDAVVMSHVIEHVAEPEALLRECLRILKPGGKLVVVTPNVSGRMHAKYRKNWLHLDPPRHLFLFSPTALATLVDKAGYRDVTVSTTVRDAAGLWRASRSLAWRGVFDMGRPATGLERIASEIAGLFFGYAHRMSGVGGDELVAVAKRKD